MSITSHAVEHDPWFPETDGVPLETNWYRKQINFLCELLESRFHDREDFYVGGNMFVYYDPDNSRKNAGPDVFYVSGVNRRPERRIWAVWEENGRYPDVIVELMSPKTKNKDRKTNKAIYETVFQTPEYFMYDPEAESLEGWRLIEGTYQPIEPNADGRMWSEQLGLWLGLCECDYFPGDTALWVRLFEPDCRLVPSYREREQLRAEAAEAELARLKALLKQTEKGHPSDE